MARRPEPFVAPSPFLSAREVVALLRASVDAQGGVTAWARRNAVSSVYVQDVLGGRRTPGPAIQVALGLRRAAAAYESANANLPEAE